MTSAVLTLRVSGSAPITGISVRARPAVTRSELSSSGWPRNCTPTTYTPVSLRTCHSSQGTVRLNCTEALGASGAPNCWNVPLSNVVSRVQLSRSLIGMSCSVATAAISALVASRLRSIHASACGSRKVVSLVLVTRPVIFTD
jgi:hypothetical protein